VLGVRFKLRATCCARCFKGAASIPPGVSLCSRSADFVQFRWFPALEDAGQKPGGGAEAHKR
jgi:hypothetical protein